MKVTIITSDVDQAVADSTPNGKGMRTFPYRSLCDVLEGTSSVIMPSRNVNTLEDSIDLHVSDNLSPATAEKTGSSELTETPRIYTITSVRVQINGVSKLVITGADLVGCTLHVPKSELDLGGGYGEFSAKNSSASSIQPKHQECEVKSFDQILQCFLLRILLKNEKLEDSRQSHMELKRDAEKDASSTPKEVLHWLDLSEIPVWMVFKRGEALRTVHAISSAHANSPVQLPHSPIAHINTDCSFFQKHDDISTPPSKQLEALPILDPVKMLHDSLQNQIPELQDHIPPKVLAQRLVHQPKKVIFLCRMLLVLSRPVLS
jgi:hypothetical protein